MCRLWHNQILHRAALMSVIICLTLGTARTSSAQANSPFIYYYSQDKSEFIVERADGSESRILASYALHPRPGVDDSIIGPGWSPSAEWFAWSSTLEAGNGGRYNAFLVKRDGGTPIKVFSTDVDVIK